MLTATSEYALRAMVVVAREDGEVSVSSRRVSRLSGVPAKYLSKILATMVRGGLLTAERWRGGGFRLGRSAAKIRLLEVIAPFEPMNMGWGCPLGTWPARTGPLAGCMSDGRRFASPMTGSFARQRPTRISWRIRDFLKNLTLPSLLRMERG